MEKIKIFKIWKNLWLETNKIEKILQKITNKTKSQLFLLDKIEDSYLEAIKKSFDKLVAWEPIEYIINNAEFYSLDFYVNSSVLIPRNDTEIIIDKAIETIIKYGWVSLIDVWTWSSCIPISILKNSNKIISCYAIDISKKALEVSKINIKKHWLENKIIQINSDLLDCFFWKNDFILNKNVIITANLPYIKNEDFENMDKETIKYEPALALFWWKKTWFELYEKLIKECFKLKDKYSIKTLILFIEIWFNQKEYSNKYLFNLWLEHYYYKDNWWIQRCIKIVI